MGTDLAHGGRSEGLLEARFSIRIVADTYPVMGKVFGMCEIRRVW